MAVSFITALLVGSRTVHAALDEVNGIASYETLNQEQFIAALYLERPERDPRRLLSDNYPGRMELRITANRVSRRSLVKLWVESVAINNDPATLTSQAENLVRFNDVFRKSLRRNDRLVLTNHPDTGVEVSLNGVSMITIASNDFFRMLLSTWIGQVPLSTHFREGILGKAEPDQSLQQRFSVLEPSVQRRQEVADWIAPPKPVVEQPPAKVVIAQAPEKVVAERGPRLSPAMTLAPSTQSVPANKIMGEERKEPVANSEIDSPRGSVELVENAAPRLEETKAPRVEPSVEKTPVVVAMAPIPISQAPVDRGRPPEPPPAAPDTTDSDDEEEVLETELDIESRKAALLRRQEYYSRLVKHLYKYKTIPFKAFQGRYDGEAVVSVEIDRSGRLLSSEIIKMSRHNVFNEQATSAIKRADPYPSIPDEISDDTYSFTVPMIYKLVR